MRVILFSIIVALALPARAAIFTVGASGCTHTTVQAAVDAAEASGLTTEFGPFGTTMTGDDDTAVLAAIDGVVRAALSAGATRLAVQIERVDP